MKHSILKLSLLSSAILLTACVTSSPTGRNQVLLFDGAEMADLGAKSFAELKTQEKINQDPKVNTYVQCVSKQITDTLGKQPDFDQWEVVVFDSEQVNAFALPGGKIGVYTGLLQVAKNQDQLAAVIGHEIAHVQANHSNERLSSSQITGYGTQIAQTAIGTTEYADMGMAALGLGVQYGITMPYGRAQESEADIVGLHLMNDAGFDAQESIALWRNMAIASGGSEPMEFLSTHPSNETRINNLSDELKKLTKSSKQHPNCSM
ncbi:M48 family metallopeptidase [Vibrio sp. 2-Bac 85]|uniref:M48 family metallopeptidase n=1 Tax=uncultured Psychromonas sp. TaxID=173974 RepID=UPI002603AD38|nr:M48 family metallopeptidase [uncultured Psychromonas sp.]